MATIPEMLRRLKSVNVEKQTPIIIQSTSEELADLNRQQLYRKGVDANNNRLAPYSSVTYALVKNERNPLPGLFNPDLYLTGKFQRGIYAQVSGATKIIFGSTDFKSDMLEKKYGKFIFGLNRDSKVFYVDNTFMPKLRAYISQRTGLVFT